MGGFKVWKALPYKAVKLPERLFKVKLKGIDDNSDKDKPRLNFKFAVLDKKYKGVTASATLWLQYDEDGNPRPSTKGEVFLLKLAGKDEMDSPVNPFDYIGTKYSALIKQTKKDEKIYNNIETLLPYETEEEDSDEEEPKKKHVEEDDEEDEPKKKHSSDDDDEDDEPKKKPSKGDEDDEESDDEDDEDEDKKPAKKDKDEDFDE